MNLKNKKMAQSGRTMTELLGSLVVMGLLGVGTISAFTVVMNRFRANNLLDEAGGRAIYLTAQFEKGRKNVTLGKFTTNDVIGGVFSQRVFTSGLSGQLGIQVSDVNKAVCERLLNSIEDTTPLRRLSLVNSPTVAITECNDKNTFLMIYNAKVKGSESDASYHCESDADCDTICATCNENNQCVGECELPVPDINEYGQECGTNECIRYDEETQTCKMACERVEYLQATGTQWMSTGITITAMDNFTANYVVTLEKKSTRGLIGYSPANHGYWGITINGYYELGSSSTSILATEGDSVVFKRTIDSTGKQFHELYINGVLARTRDRATGETGKFSLWAIANGGYRASGKIYSFQMELNGENVLDFTPVISPDGEPCMFDKISQKLFCNSGSGDFQTNLDE